MLRLITAAGLGALGSLAFVGLSGVVLLYGLDKDLLGPAIGIVAGIGALIGIAMRFSD